MSLSLNESTELTKKGNIISNRYEVISQIGVGGMGTVLKVKDLAVSNEILALKIINPDLARDLIQFGRFRNEVLITRKLSHPYIVKLYDFGSTADGLYYISMEYVDGGTLTDRIYKESLSQADACVVILQILSGLSYAHQDSVIHRDLKPDNILIDKKGISRITDFGLARSTMVDKNFTVTGETVGTPHYMSPEQLAGELVDARADLYSLGIMCFEMMQKKRPFISSNYFDLAKMHFETPIPDLSKLDPKIPDWFSKFVKICCAKNKDNRFSTSTEAINYLLKHLGSEFREYSIPLGLF